jgi:hypothetical protein
MNPRISINAVLTILKYPLDNIMIRLLAFDTDTVFDVILANSLPAKSLSFIHDIIDRSFFGNNFCGFGQSIIRISSSHIKNSFFT